MKEMDVFGAIKRLLDGEKVQYRLVEHAPTKTSEESALARGEPLSIGGKAIVLKINGSFKLFVLSAACRLDSSRIKRYFKARGLRFATRDELFELTGLEPGSVPPFGTQITRLELYVDSSITRNARIAFNAGLLTRSIIMAVDDYMRIASPVVFDFSKRENESG
jgi:Ala-tRNA(Pro) deacylase